MSMADALGFFGRLHPLVVHLPIGALSLALILDLISYRFGRDQFRRAVRLCLLIGSVSAIVACIFGYLLSLSVGYDADALNRHMYAGIAMAILSGMLYFVIASPKTFTALLLSMTALLVYTGHQGGNLTYGDDYFFKEPEPVVINAEPVIVYDTLTMEYVQHLRTKDVTVRVMLQQPVMLDVTIMPEAKINLSEIIPDLEAIAPKIIQLNLSNNDLNSADLSFLPELINLEKLRLEKNPVDDDVVQYLLDLKHLTAVNLYGTKITSAGVEKLKTNPSIQRVYTWDTKAE